MLRKIALSPTGQMLASLLAVLYLRLVRFTSRLTYVNRQAIDDLRRADRALIGLLWHGRLLIAPYAWNYDAPQHYLISRHGDGEIIARVMRLLGANTVRGSAANPEKDADKGGAVALRQLLKLLRANESVGLTPDGPRGPGMRMSEGTVTLARLSGAPVLPVAYASSRRRILKTWDRFHLPLPFSRIVIVYGTPLEVPRDLDDSGVEEWRLRLERALNAATEQADRLVGQPTVTPATDSAEPAS
jgi:lysophospholipid acyltransferase (LPLAT)-like uncharacterized protein